MYLCGIIPCSNPYLGFVGRTSPKIHAMFVGELHQPKVKTHSILHKSC